MKPVQRVLTLALVFAALSTCRSPNDGPERIVWDRDTCASCSMAISDHHFAAELRGGPHSKLEKFDELGCALRFLERQTWANDPTVKLWVAHSSDGRWLDARTATYLPTPGSPMGFNHAAFDATTTDAGVSFETLRERLKTAPRASRSHP